MRKKLAFFGVALSVLLSGYSIAAWRLLWRTRAYRLNTSVGAILAGSRPYTTLASLLLLVIMVSGLSIQRRVQRMERMTSLKRILLTGEKKLPKKGDGTNPMEPVPAEYATPSQGKEAPAPMREKEVASSGRTGTAPTPNAKGSGTAPMPNGTASSENIMPRQCRKCGAALKPGQRFCKDCGSPAEGGDVL